MTRVEEPQLVSLPELVREKLRTRNFWQFATVCDDGAPTASPVWADLDGSHVLVNTAIGRRKERNVRRDPRVALAMVDLENPYLWIEIRGQVVEFVEGPAADESINRLTRKYLDLDEYPARQPGERRVLLRIVPTKVLLRAERGSGGSDDGAASEERG